MCYTHRPLKHSFNLISGLYQRLLWHSRVSRNLASSCENSLHLPFWPALSTYMLKGAYREFSQLCCPKDPVNHNSIINGFIILFFFLRNTLEEKTAFIFVARRPIKAGILSSWFFCIIYIYTHTYVITKNDFICRLSQKCFWSLM